LPNHFHLLIKTSYESSHNEVSEQFRKFLISYSKSFNKYHSRSGTLFEKHLKRILVDSDEYLIWIILYIHRNPVHHNISKNFRSYIWSSYRSIISEKQTRLARDEVIQIFSSRDSFISFHEKNISDFEFMKDFTLE
jgi:hypothetical protein